jgi:NAD(P)-dependent dehydrogenase (short-subunit alcohol dehydrogenase family)
MASLAGRHVVVTGGSMGIGRAVGEGLASRGARVTLIARGREALEQTCASLPGTGHAWAAFDVSDEAAWRDFASGLDRLDGLVCAAAVIEPVGGIGTYEPSAFRRTIEINLLGSQLGIFACLPALRASEGSVVLFGGGGATSPLPRYDAYAASKAAVVRLAENLGSVLGEDGIRINCVAPGFVITRMHEATLAAGPEGAGERYFERTRAGIDEGGFPASEAAELVCLLVEGVPFTGKLISAQWDPWRKEGFQAELASDPDLGTLRRIDGMHYGALGKEPA